MNFLKVFTADDSVLAVVMEDERPLRAALQQYVRNGVNDLITVTHIDGSTVDIIISHVCSVQVSTPDTRHAASIIDNTLSEEWDAARDHRA